MRFQDLIGRGTRANQPAATAVSEGSLYYVTDEQVTERSTGAAWEDVTDAGGGGGGGGGGLVLLEQHAAAGSASLDFTTGITAAYDDYLFRIVGLFPATDNTSLLLRCSTDGGASFDAGTNYGQQVRIDHNLFNGVGGADSGLSALTFFPDADTGAPAFSINGRIEMFNPLSASLYTTFLMQGTHRTNDGRNYLRYGSGWHLSAAAVNAVRFVMSAGNIASGTIRLYGVEQ